MLHAAAAVTQESCQLLSIKSVGVDYGLVRTGVAVTVGYDPKPLAILTDLNATRVSQQVVRYCRSEQASRVIVGLPLHKNGTVAEQTNLTLNFSQELAKHVLRELGPGVPVLLWDERYTSKEAAARAHSQDPW
jgi:RNase H-fold protein (predicted Holliday junction resolvase)